MQASWLLKAVASHGLEAPTAVQQLATPAALCGKDVLALAETGSGKTLAYGWPALAHCCAQRRCCKGEGCVALVLCPTRELSEQIYRELSKYARFFPSSSGSRGPLSTVAVFGGAGKWEMAKALGAGADLVVATPGRLIELVGSGCTDLHSRCTFVVVDEADRMFDMGFAEQLRCLLQRVRPKRQTLLCTATLAPKLDALARSALRDPVRIVVGRAGKAFVANDAVHQSAHVLPNAAAKFSKTSQRCIMGTTLFET